MEVWLYGILFVGLIVAASVSGMLLVHRFTRLEFLESHNEVAGFIYAIVGVVYAVLLTFVVSFVWEKHKTAEERVEAEANNLGDLFRDAEVFPTASRQNLQDSIRAYVRAVQNSEWRAMAEGKASSEAWRAYNRLWQTYADFVPLTEQQRIWYTEAIGDLSEVGDSRRLRLLSNNATVPGILWVSIVVGGVVTIAFGYFFGTKNRSAHVLMVIAISGIIGLNLYVVYALDHPFQGLSPIRLEAFDQLTEIFNRWSLLR